MRKLVEERLKYFGLIYVIFLAIIVVVGTIFISRLPEFTQERLQLDTLKFPKDTVNLQADLPVVKGTISPPVNIFNLATPTPDQVEKGKGLFTTNCVTCHGPEGKGDGVAGAMMNPKPRNFTSLDGWTNGPKLTQMYKTLQEGITNKGMASYAQLPPEDRVALIHYIHETFTKNYPKASDEELKELDKTYSLSTGAKLPNQIPVTMAMDKILKEKNPFDHRIDTMKFLVNNNKTDSGAVILKSISNNLTKSLTVLALDSSWNANEKSLVDMFIQNPVQNGFRAKAYALTARELSLLHAYLRNLFTQIK